MAKRSELKHFTLLHKIRNRLKEITQTSIRKYVLETNYYFTKTRALFYRYL